MQKASLSSLIPILIPTLLALSTGVWLEANRVEPLLRSLRETKVQQVESLEHTLANQLRDELAITQMRALALADLNQKERVATPEFPILQWTELSANLELVKQSANPDWKRSADFENHYLQALPRQLNLQELKNNGVAVLRVQGDASSSSELVSLAFENSQTHGVETVLLAASDAFPAFSQLASKDHTLRAYLMGSDGLAILHSRKNDIGASFAQTPIFTQALQPLLKYERISGWGEYLSIDHEKVMAFYSRLGTLPLAVVVEKIVNPIPLWNLAWIEKLIASLFALFVCVVLAYRLIRDRPESARAPARITAPLLEETYVVTESAPQINPEFFLEPPTQPKVAAPQAVSFKTTAREDVLLTRLEIECAHFSEDPKKVSAKMTEFASLLFEAPALFFSYHERVGAAVLQAQNGLKDFKAVGMSFAVKKDECAQTSFASHAALKTLLEERLDASSFQCWALHNDEEKLLGVLVVLAAQESSDRVSVDSRDRMVRSANRLYAESHKRSLNPS